MKTVIVIPARYGSSRLKGKPLREISGKPLIQWVFEGAMESKLADEVLVATDDERIKGVVEGFGGRAVLTPPDVPSGTDRVYKAIEETDFDLVINLQGDEPMVRGDLLDAIIEELRRGEKIVTCAYHPENIDEIGDSNRVKVVLDESGYALYFSRSPIPFIRSGRLRSGDFLIHGGVYGFERETLKRFVRMGEGRLEKLEGLEQLRALERGIRIKVLLSDMPLYPVDTPSDLIRVERVIGTKHEFSEGRNR
ncbi:MAG: 3-deoxy-manno-octulosonate cytidylyltransferase [Candidatus Hydrothermota bacterium]|nr:MAG: 3-deoxy-manno-octulosonate cytidylyltransferase [Candidatus Hydrothermae bacterium]